MAKPAQIQLEFIRPKMTPVMMGKIPDMKQWFTIKETCIIFAVSEATVRNWVDDGTLEARSISNPTTAERMHIRITRESIVKLNNDETRRVI